VGAPYAAPAYFGAPSREEELEMLRSQADWLKEQMEAVNQRIGELGKQKS
jgi:prefoldin subunit 5